MSFFERFLRVLYQIGLDKEESRRAKRQKKSSNSQSFSNPAFIPSNNISTISSVKYDSRQQINNSMRIPHSNKSKKCVRRSKSCPTKKNPKSIIPKIKL